MGGFEHAMFRCVHRFGLLLCWFAPKQKYHVVALRVDHFDHVVCEFLPAAFSMRVGLALLDCQAGIEQEYALFGPVGQVTMVRH